MIKIIKQVFLGVRVEGESVKNTVSFKSVYPERFSQDTTTDFNKTWEHIHSVRK